MSKKSELEINKHRNSPVPQSTDNVEQIREILFGGQMRDYDYKFRELEHRLDETIQRLELDVRDRVSDLDRTIREQLERLDRRVSEVVEEGAQTRESDRAEVARSQQQAEDRFVALDQKTASIAEHAESRLSELDGKTASEGRLIQATVQEQAGQLMGAIRRTHEEFSEALNTQVRQLSDSKVARDDLAKLLNEVATQLEAAAGRDGNHK